MHEAFAEERQNNIRCLGQDMPLRELTTQWLATSARHKYSYNFTWMGRPIIQYPQDMVAMQEIIWQVQPDLIIETGVAHGGSLIFYASLLELIGGAGRVIGVDVDIRAHNRAAIESHSMAKRITMIQGSSIADTTVAEVSQWAEGRKKILVALDSNHTHEHVLQELIRYSPLVTKESYLVVFDTIIEDMPSQLFANRPWKPGNNPLTAVAAFLRTTDRFVVEREWENKLLITVARSGYLKCIKDQL